MQYLKYYPVSSILISLYLFLTVAVGIYALTCDTQWCSLALVIPIIPWPQLESALGLNLPRFLLPAAVLLNTGLLYYLGHIIERLFIRKNQ